MVGVEARSCDEPLVDRCFLVTPFLRGAVLVLPMRTYGRVIHGLQGKRYKHAADTTSSAK